MYMTTIQPLFIFNDVAVSRAFCYAMRMIFFFVSEKASLKDEKGYRPEIRCLCVLVCEFLLCIIVSIDVEHKNALENVSL